MSTERRAVIVDADLTRARVTATALARAGYQCRVVQDAQKAFASDQDVPSVLLLHAEPSDPSLKALSAALGKSPRGARVPIILICQDRSAAGLVQEFRTGVVAMLPAPFVPATYPGRIDATLADLASRSGTVQGDVATLVQHARSFGRSGALEQAGAAAALGAAPARALFVQGALQSAEFEGLVGEDALQAMQDSHGVTWAFSELPGVQGEGTEIFVTLDDGSPSASPAEPDVPAPEARTRLLLVDDDESLCAMFKAFFSKRGFDVTVARDGVEGFDVALSGTFEVVVADLNMPKLDGWGLLRRLRDDFRTRELPFAMLSNQDSYRESLEALKAGAQAYFSKASRLEALAQRLRDLLQPRQALREGLASAGGGPLAISVLGPQWVLRELSAARASGRLDARDGWAVYALAFVQGNIVSVQARTGEHRAQGERAFNAFIASRAAEGRWSPGEAQEATQYLGPTETMIERAVRVLNANTTRAREALLIHPGPIEVDPELYRVYQTHGPKAWLETARLLCEERLPPREVLARIPESPLEVEETLRDLLRRGVVTFKGRG